MSRSIRIPFLIVGLLTLTLSAGAQNQVSAISIHLKQGQAIPSECQLEAQVFKQIASVYPHPKTGWSFVVICDEDSWNAALRRMGINDPLREHFGETDIDHDITYIRGWSLVHYRAGYPTRDHIIAHELAHIMLNSRDEQLVDTTARRWVNRRDTVEIAGGN